MPVTPYPAATATRHGTSQRDFLQVLVTAPCDLIQRFLPGMTERGYGRILNVASVAGLMPGSASHTLYGGAKAMLIKISQSLHNEQNGYRRARDRALPGIYLLRVSRCDGNTRRDAPDAQDHVARG